MDILQSQQLNQMYGIQLEFYRRMIKHTQQMIKKVGEAYEENPIEIDPSLGQIHYKDYLNYIRSKTCLGLHDSWVYLLQYLHDKRYHVGVDVGDGEAHHCVVVIDGDNIVKVYSDGEEKEETDKE